MKRLRRKQSREHKVRNTLYLEQRVVRRLNCCRIRSTLLVAPHAGRAICQRPPALPFGRSATGYLVPLGSLRSVRRYVGNARSARLVDSR